MERVCGSIWNGISYLPPPGLLPTVEMTSDASGSWGCGAWHDNSWFQVQWDSRSRDLLIAVKELIPIVMACATWGAKWRGHRVVCHCDNQVVVACLRTRSSRHEGIMHLLRCLVFIEAHFDCFLHPEYINTKQNHLADDLSCPLSFQRYQEQPTLQPRPAGPSPQPSGRLDLAALAPSVQRYFQSGLAPSTQKTYGAALKRFHAFCIKFNVTNPFPATKQLLCSFVTFLADQGLAPQRGKSYLSAVRSMQISLGLPDRHDQSSLPVVKRV